MRFAYFAPAPALRPLIGCYYLFDAEVADISDVLRAEIANVRFMIRGRTEVLRPDGWRAYPGATVLGPSTIAAPTRGMGPIKMFGAGIMPAGWNALFGIDADELANDHCDLGAFAGSRADATLEAMREAHDDLSIVAAADALFLRMARKRRWARHWFTDACDGWLLEADDLKLSTLRERADLSARQIERLAKRFYGASPKLLQRKYRTLHAAARMSFGHKVGWLEAAGDDFYDQSHFIHDFKGFIGTTPGQFLKVGAPVMRLSIRARQTLPTIPRLTLIS